MTVADTAPPIRLDRYLALLAILLGLVLALLVIGEREKPPPPPPTVVGTLPPPPDPRLARIATEREALLAEQAKLADALDASEAALARALDEAAALAGENERLRQLLGDEGAALDQLTGRLAAVEAERDRLRDEVAALDRTREQQATRLVELEAELEALRAVSADGPDAAVVPEASTSPSTALSTGPSATVPTVGETLPTPATPPAGATGATSDVEPAVVGLSGVAGAPAGNEAAGDEAADVGPVPESAGPPQRLTTFDNRDGGDGGTVEDGVEAYRTEDYARAERIWRALAAAGNRRAQFYFGSLLFEGRTGPPDRIMAHVWLSRSVDNGYLPAIEVRRQVRAAMSEAEYAAALAIEAGG